jgi:hypothetical protein
LSSDCAARKLNRVADLPVSPVGLAWQWLAGRVLLKIVCLLTRWLFSLIVLVVRGDQAKNGLRSRVPQSPVS